MVSWNVNSINARLPHFVDLLTMRQPMIVCLQELKVITENFPYDAIDHLGYNFAVNGQKTYNGVAILSKFPIEDIKLNFVDNPDPLQARFIEALITVDGQVYRVISVYVPNGESLDSSKFVYKIKFLEALYNYVQELLQNKEKLIISGDFNVAPFAIDLCDKDRMQDSILCSDLEKKMLRKFLYNGLYDAFRLKYPNKQEFSWWDYRAGAFQKNEGARIDHVLISAEAANNLMDMSIDMNSRAKERPSDHAPIFASFL